MAQTPLDQAKLIQGLEADLAKAEQTVSRSEMGRGQVSEPARHEQSFRPKGIRFKGKVIAAAELKKAQKEMDNAIEYLAENQQFKNETERRSFKHELTKRMNQFQMNMLKSGAQMEFELQKRGMDQDAQHAMYGSFGDAVGGAAMAAIAFSKTAAPKDDAFGSNKAISDSQQYIEGPMQSPGMGQASGYGNTPRPMPSPTPGGAFDFFKRNNYQTNPQVTPNQDATKNFMNSFKGKKS